jgi:rubredoxin
MMFIIVVLVALAAQTNIEAFTSSRFQLQSRSPLSSGTCKSLLMSSSEPQVKITEIFLTPKVEEENIVPNYDNESEEERYKRTKLAEIAEKQALEVFVSRNTGKWECQSCGYVYSEDKGNEKYNIKAGTPFDQIEKFRCPQVNDGQRMDHFKKIAVPAYKIC